MEEEVRRISELVSKRFPSFGGGSDPLASSNPVAAALEDRAPMFGLGVSVEEVVRFVLGEMKK